MQLCEALKFNMGTDFEASNFDAWCDVEHLLEDIAHDLIKYDDKLLSAKISRTVLSREAEWIGWEDANDD